MKYKYNVKVSELKEVHEIPMAWSNEDFKNLLERLEYEDITSIADEELKDMCVMALSDLEAEEAAELVLEYRFGEKLKVGQRKNLSEELKDDRLWEEYAEIAYHEELFNVACIVHWAFPKIYPLPDIVKLKLIITSQNSESKGNVMNPTPSFLCRLLIDGMDEHNAIYRLFEDSIKGNSFPEAEDIIWKYESSGFDSSDNSNTLTLYSSWNWLDELKGVSEFESSAYSDGQGD